MVIILLVVGTVADAGSAYDFESNSRPSDGTYATTTPTRTISRWRNAATISYAGAGTELGTSGTMMGNMGNFSPQQMHPQQIQQQQA